MLSYYYHHSKYPITTSASSTPTSSSHISIARIKNFSSNLSTNETDLSSSINTDQTGLKGVMVWVDDIYLKEFRSNNNYNK